MSKNLTTPEKLAKIIRTPLSLSLALSLSGLLPVASAAFASPTASGNTLAGNALPVNIRAAMDQATALEEQMNLLVRRARHPNSPGTPPGIPTAEEMTSIETSFQDWQQKIEQALTLPDKPLPNTPSSTGDSGHLPKEAKRRAIRLYLNELTLLATLRISLNLSHGPSWSNAYALRVPRAAMSDFSGVGVSETDRLGSRYLPLVIDNGEKGNNVANGAPRDGQDHQAENVRLKLSSSLVQGLELGRLADHPDDTSYLTLVQYIAVRQLMGTLTDLRYLKQDHHIDLPEIPQQLRAKLETLGLVQTIDDEQRRAVAEPGARVALTGQFAQVSNLIPPFATDAYVQELANMIGKNPHERISLAGPLKASLVQAETNQLQYAIEQEIVGSPLPLSQLGATEMMQALRTFITSAKANTHLGHIALIHANGTLDDSVNGLSAGQRLKILQSIDNRKSEYLATIPEALLNQWHQAAKLAAEDSLFARQRSEFVENLLYQAPQVVTSTQRTFAGDSIAPQALASAYDVEIAKMAPSSSVGQWFFDITHAGSYSSSRDRYNQTMGSLTTPTVVTGGLVDPGKVREYLAHHQFHPDIEFSSKVNPELAKRIITRVIDSEKLDIQNLLTMGEWLGFHRAFPNANPSVTQLLTDKNHLDRYFQALDERALTENPILNANVIVGTESDPHATARLADALASINPHWESNPQIMDRAQLLVDQALIQSEEKIKQDISKVAQATSLEQIEKIVTSSMMLSLVMKSFPEFQQQQRDYIEEMLTPSLTHQIMHRYVGNYLTWGFLAIGLIHGSKFIAEKSAEKLGGWAVGRAMKRAAGPLGLVAMGVDSVLAGYVRSAMIVILADTAYQAFELKHVRDGKKQVDEFFDANVTGRGFFDEGEVKSADSAYEWAKWMFIGRMAMDSAFMYFPIMKGVVNRVGDAVIFREFEADCEAFKALELRPAEFSQVEAAIANARLLQSAGTLGKTAEEFAELERAYSRLSDKIATGQTYRMPNVVEQIARETAFKRLSLNPGQPESWDKIDEALKAYLETGFRSSAETKNARDAGLFLKDLLAEDPGVRTREFKPASKTERKLMAAMGRGGYADHLIAMSSIKSIPQGPSLVLPRNALGEELPK